MHVLYVLRLYLGYSQMTLSSMAGITQPDLSEMETKAPYGYLDKYSRVSDLLGIPLDCLLKNDFSMIPESFFDRHPPREYNAAVPTEEGLLGRAGEEYILAREQTRLRGYYPALAKLVLPFYKLRGVGNRPGYDILSFDNHAKPIYLEVKTSTSLRFDFNLTPNEMRTAQKLTKAGEEYRVVLIRGWGKSGMWSKDISFAELTRDYKVEANRYCCSPIPEKDKRTMSGIAYYRRLNGMRQSELAAELKISPNHFSQYETGVRQPTVDIYLKLSDLLDASVEQLLGTYEPSQLAEEQR